MMKKFLALMLALIVLLNFSAVTCAKTPEEKAAAKAAKLQKKQEKQILKAARKNNIKTVEAWANGGDQQAQFILAYAKQTGQRIQRDRKAAKELFTKLKKVNAELVENFIPLDDYGKKVKLPRLYGIAASNSQIGKYVPINFDDVIKWAELGASEKDTLSFAILGSAYYTGRGVRQDYKQAIEYLKLAGAEPVALSILADAYAKGNGVDKNPKQSKFYENYLKLVTQPKIDKRRDRNSKKLEKQAK